MLMHDEWSELNTAFPGRYTITLLLTLSNGDIERVQTNMRLEQFQKYYLGQIVRLSDGTPVNIVEIKEA